MARKQWAVSHAAPRLGPLFALISGDSELLLASGQESNNWQLAAVCNLSEEATFPTKKFSANNLFAAGHCLRAAAKQEPMLQICCRFLPGEFKGREWQGTGQINGQLTFAAHSARFDWGRPTDPIRSDPIALSAWAGDWLWPFIYYCWQQQQRWNVRALPQKKRAERTRSGWKKPPRRPSMSAHFYLRQLWWEHSAAACCERANRLAHCLWIDISLRRADGGKIVSLAQVVVLTVQP